MPPNDEVTLDRELLEESNALAAKSPEQSSTRTCQALKFAAGRGDSDGRRGSPDAGHGQPQTPTGRG